MSSSIISRLAPTPSGYLHTGNVFNFILTWLEVRAAQGQLYLRIDDLDRSRVKRKFVDNIFETLEWLGMDYDAGPRGTDDFFANHSQVHRTENYKAALEVLANAGHTYNCQCSRKETAQNAIKGQYAGTCRTLGHPFVEGKTSVRLNTSTTGSILVNGIAAEEKLDEIMRDFIVLRSDGLVSYQLASVVDDHLLGCNLIVRGTDLWPSTLAQVFLAERLGYTPFSTARFIHHPLLLTWQKQKISKSQNAETVRQQYPKRGALCRAAGEWLGLGEGLDNLAMLLEKYVELKNEGKEITFH